MVVGVPSGGGEEDPGSLEESRLGKYDSPHGAVALGPARKFKRNVGQQLAIRCDYSDTRPRDKSTLNFSDKGTPALLKILGFERRMVPGGLVEGRAVLALRGFSRRRKRPSWGWDWIHGVVHTMVWTGPLRVDPTRRRAKAISHGLISLLNQPVGIYDDFNMVLVHKRACLAIRRISVDGYTGFCPQSTLPFMLPEGADWTMGLPAEDFDR